MIPQTAVTQRHAPLTLRLASVYCLREPSPHANHPHIIVSPVLLGLIIPPHVNANDTKHHDLVASTTRVTNSNAGFSDSVEQL